MLVTTGTNSFISLNIGTIICVCISNCYSLAMVVSGDIYTQVATETSIRCLSVGGFLDIFVWQFDSFPTEKVKIVTINNERKVVNLNVIELTLLLCYVKCENHSHG